MAWLDTDRRSTNKNKEEKQTGEKKYRLKKGGRPGAQQEAKMMEPGPIGACVTA